jgi:hypothetical protein
MWLAIAVAFVWFGATVKLGRRTFFQHVSAIWSTPEAQDMKKGIEEKAGPAFDKIERGVKAGYREATSGDDGGTRAPSEHDTHVPSPQDVTGTDRAPAH